MPYNLLLNYKCIKFPPADVKHTSKENGMTLNKYLQVVLINNYDYRDV